MNEAMKPEDKLVQAMRRMRHLRLAEMPAADTDLTISQIQMVAFIATSPDCHIQDIAGGLGLSAPTVSVAVRRLEEQGWLARQPDPQDGRAACISLTDQSMQMMQKIKTAQYQAVQAFLAGLTADEQEQLISLLERAIGAAEQRAGVPDKTNI